MLVEDFRLLNGSFRSCALFQNQRNIVTFNKPKNKKLERVFSGRARGVYCSPLTTPSSAPARMQLIKVMMSLIYRETDFPLLIHRSFHYHSCLGFFFLYNFTFQYTNNDGMRSRGSFGMESQPWQPKPVSVVFLGCVRTYAIHLLGTYVTILCNWLSLWQNALYL